MRGQTPLEGAKRATLAKLGPFALLAAAIVAAPTWVCKPSAAGSNYHLTVLIYVGINTVLAVGLNLLMGYAGQVSLGHAAFYGLGAYVSAILTTTGVPRETWGLAAVVAAAMVAGACMLALLGLEGAQLAAAGGGFVLAAALALKLGAGHWLVYAVAVACCVGASMAYRLPPAKLGLCYGVGGAAGVATWELLAHGAGAGALSPWWAMLVGVLFVCLTAYLVGAQALRLQGHYLAMATLGFGVIVSIVLLQWEPVTGGTSGIYGIPSLQIAGLPLDRDVRMYYVVWALVVVVIAMSSNVVDSRVGRAFRAVHGREAAAASVGVETFHYKVQVFVLSAALASVAGSLYAHYVTFISPEPFGFKFSIELVVMVVVGGMASIWGAIFGAATVTMLGEALRALGRVNVGRLPVPLSDLDVVVFGLILVLIMVYLPAGLVRSVVDSLAAAGRLRRHSEDGS